MLIHIPPALPHITLSGDCTASYLVGTVRHSAGTTSHLVSTSTSPPDRAPPDAGPTHRHVRRRSVTCRVIGRPAGDVSAAPTAGPRQPVSAPAASRALVNVLPAFARFALDVAAPDVLALAALDPLHGERVVRPAAAHGLAAVVRRRGGVTLPATQGRVSELRRTGR